MATRVEETIEVEVPVSTAYNQWTQFEEFPQFMGGVQTVTQTSPQMTHWVVQVGGVKREWDAAILDQVPDTRVAWAATSGATNAGAVAFVALGPGRTMVRLVLEYEPEGLVEKAGDALGIVERRAKADLHKFKEFIEDRGRETGAWRGSVGEGAAVGVPGVEDAELSRGDSGSAGITKGAAVAGAAVLAGVAAAGVAAVKSHHGQEGHEDHDADVVATPTTGTAAPVTPVTPVTTTTGTGVAGSAAGEPAPLPAGDAVDEAAVEDVLTRDTSGRAL